MAAYSVPESAQNALLDMYKAVQNALDAFEDAYSEVDSFVTEAEDAFNERSDAFQESTSGQRIQDWIDEWDRFRSDLDQALGALRDVEDQPAEEPYSF